MNNINNDIRSIELLNKLDDVFLNSLGPGIVRKDIKANEIIIRREAESSEVHGLIHGKARVSNVSMDGREILHDYIFPGSLFGELSAIDEHSRSANVTADEDSVILIIPRAHFIKMITSSNEIALVVMKRLCKIIRISDDRVVDLSTLNAYDRVRIYLARMAVREENETGLPRISPIPNHSSIAAIVSTSRETVARAISSMIVNKEAVRGDSYLEIVNARSILE